MSLFLKGNRACTTVIDDQSEVFHKSTCTCKICKETNEFSLKWNEWKPSNNIETILHSAIEKIDSEFNLV